MRLICPSCSAAYRIPDSALPPDGREVQCSACAHSWYQLPLTPKGSDAPPEDGAEPARSPEDRFFEPEDPQPRRPIDPEVLAVLKAEAKRETDARRREAAGLPPATDTSPRPLRERAAFPQETIRDRLARLKQAEASRAKAPDWPVGEESDTALPGPGPSEPPQTSKTAVDNGKQTSSKQASTGTALTPARPAQLPATLTPAEVAVIYEKRQRKGFRLGFTATAGLCFVLVALFLAGPRLAAGIPASKPLLTPFLAAGEAAQSAISSRFKASVQRLHSGEG